jgi:short subunit dehydrogenase-like uncharacterized protein
MPERDFDVVLYGASGFTGRQTVRYFEQHAPPDLRWAVAGRNLAKLQALNSKAPVLVADSSDQSAIDRVIASTRVVANTAGPFALYGDAIVDACVRFRTHYADITGEALWVRSLIDRYHVRAAAEGTRIIPFCGFDSVPADLGANWIAGKAGPEVSEVKACFAIKSGAPNGGTIASVLNLVESGAADSLSDPFLLSPEMHRPLRDLERDPARPRYDPDLKTWVAPFIMSVVDTRVVRRSCALLGRDFAYQEYMRCSGPVQAVIVAAATSLFQRALRFSPIRQLVRKLAPEPGSGPSEKAMEEGWFRCDLFARTPNGRARGRVAGKGDPANRITVKCLCESALALACDTDRLPALAGILTPYSGIGDVLIARLSAKGIRFELVS